VTFSEFCEIAHVGRSRGYEILNSGVVKSVLVGGSRLVLIATWYDLSRATSRRAAAVHTGSRADPPRGPRGRRPAGSADTTETPRQATEISARGASAGNTGEISKKTAREHQPGCFRSCRCAAVNLYRQRPWLTTFAPILISFSCRLVSDHGSVVVGIASVRMKLLRMVSPSFDDLIRPSEK